MWRDLIDFFWPRTCHICGVTLHEEERGICNRCVESLPRTLYHLDDLNPMSARFAGQVPYERATGHFFYSRNSPLASLVHDMKYRSFPSLGRRLGEIAGGELFTSGFFCGADYVAGVPMHWLKKARRGYNQAEEIAEGVADAAGLRVYTGLRAVRGHHTQTALTLEERQRNLAGIFQIRNPEMLSGKGLVLVDDVCTTGTTLLTLASAISAQVPDCRLFLLSMCVTI